MAVAETNYAFVPPDVTVLSVSQLNAKVRSDLEAGYKSVWVEGEISNFKLHTSGHAYFSLKDEESCLKAVIYRGQLSKLPVGFEPKDGLDVVATGYLTIYQARGEYQIQVSRMYPKGIGAAELALRQLREKLSRLGYFDTRRKRRPPRFPRYVALVSSATGAAVRDMIKILGRRWPAAKVFVRPSRVQGEGAAEELAEAIIQINRWKTQKLCPTDVIILGRGGGSSEDLDAFNQEVLAQAIFASKIPIVSAVGHEVDVTIADLVADVRASTPSHAAEIVAPDRGEIICQVQACAERMSAAQTQRFRLLLRRLEDLASRRVLREPLDPIRERERALDDWSERLARVMQTRLSQTRSKLDASAAQLESLSPLNVLGRGYSMTSAEATGKLIQSADQVKVGERIITRLREGRIVSRVEETETTSNKPE